MRRVICSTLLLAAGLFPMAMSQSQSQAQETDSSSYVSTNAELSVDSDENWMQWRGPNFNGSSLTATPPIEFSAEKNVKWKVEIPGKGSSTPIIFGEKVIVLSAVDTGKEVPAADVESKDENESSDQSTLRTRRQPTTQSIEVPPPQPAANRQERQQRGRQQGGRRGRGGRGSRNATTLHDFNVLCFNKDTGEQLWSKTLTSVVPHEAGHATNNFASTSPVTNGEHIFINFGSRGIYCLDFSGNIVWQRDYGQMRTRNSFGEGSSPALYEDTLVVPWDHEEQSYMIALDAKTGKEKWRVERDELTTWATPLIVPHDGIVQVVTNGTKVRSYNLEDGDLLWECGGQASNPIPSPIQLGDHVICMTGYRGFSIVSMDLDSSGDITDTDAVAWSSNDAAPYVPSGVLYNGKLYYTKSNDGMIASRDAETGEEIMELTRLPKSRQVYASLVAADGKIFACSREGTVVVMKDGPELETLAVNDMGETIDGSPALVGNRIYLRGEKHLFCIEAETE